VLRLPRKMNMDMSKALRLPPNMKSSFETASKTIIAPVIQQNQTIEMRRVGGSKGAFRTRLPQNLTVCSYKIDVFLWFFQIFPNEPRNLLPQNQCFMRGFCQFSSHVTKRHACHTICTFSPLDAPLTMRFAKKHASQSAALPPEMNMDMSKALRLPRQTQVIF